MSYHLIAFELTDQLLYINFPSFERKIILKNSEVYVAVLYFVVIS